MVPRGKANMGVVNFRQHAEAGSLPSESSIEYEGLFYDYMFATGAEKNLFFAPKFSSAISKDPITGKREHWLSMGLNSKLDGAGLQTYGGRPNLNLVLVIDVSGSMNCSFDQGEDHQTSKLTVAKEAVTTGLLPQLKEGDILGALSFTETAKLILSPLNIRSDTGSIAHVFESLQAGGGTSLSAGMRAAGDMLGNMNEKKTSRIFYFTDMCPNQEDQDAKSMIEMMTENAAKGIFTTFVGIGVDLNTQLVQKFSVIKGCNWFSVHSAKSFKKLMNEDFAYIVTPAAYDVKVIIGSDAPFSTDVVYGSPGDSGNQEGVLCEVNSVFPSAKPSETLTKGGVVAIKLKSTSETTGNTSVLPLVTKYFDPKGEAVRFTTQVTFKDEESYWEDDCVRKAVLLTRYVTFTKAFLRDANFIANKTGSQSTFANEGLVDLTKATTLADVKAAYLPHFEKLQKYFEAESDALQDPQLPRTWELLASLFKSAVTPTPQVASDEAAQQ